MKLHEISNYLQLECENTMEITGLNTLIDAKESEISFLENKKYLKDLHNTKAAAVLIKEEFAAEVPKQTIALISPEPYLMLARTSKLFAPNLVESSGKEPIIGANCTIMSKVIIGKNTNIGNNCTLMSGVFVGDNVCIGDNTILYPNVTLYRDCVIGKNCIVHANSVIGSDGFGFAHTKEGKYIKIYQNGNVIIGNDVEIGSNTSIDRATFNSTIIGDGVRIDNLVHIAHNCVIKEGCILTGQVGLSGSTTLHEYVIMGGQSATAGHLEIAPFSTIAARGGVSKSITEPKKQWAGFPLMDHRLWLKLQGKIAQLLK